MDDKFHELIDTLFIEYSKNDWLNIIKIIKKHIRDGESDVKTFKKYLKDIGMTEDSIERECITRMKLRGLISREDAYKRIIEMDKLHTKTLHSQ